MRLSHGKSQKSFVKNLKTEMEHGKPQKQALAIAYSMKRKAKKMSDGGDTAQPSPSPEPQDATKTNDPHVLSVIKGMSSGFAHGGETGASMACPSCGYAHGGKVHEDEAQDKELIQEEMSKRERAIHAFAHGGKAKLGSGARFKAVEKSAAASGAENPVAVAAAAGRKKYGAEKMAHLAAAGKKHHHAHGGEVEKDLDKGLEQHVNDSSYEHEENETGYDHKSPGNYQEDEKMHEEPETHPAEEQRSGYDSELGQYHAKHNESTAHEDSRKLGQHGAIELGPEDGGGFHSESYMGRINDPHDEYQPENPGTDLVGRVMSQHQERFSEGGKVANEDHPLEGDFDSLDDLVLDDDLHSTYGEDNNAGDENDDEGENERRHDIVARIMASRKKRDRLPSPA